MRKVTILQLLAFYAVILTAAPALTAPPPSLTLHAGFYSESGYDNNPGGREASEVLSGLSLHMDPVEIGYQRVDYTWSGQGKEPIETLQTISASFLKTHMFNATWGVTGGISLASRFEEETDDSLSGTLFAAALYRRNDWIFTFGGGVTTHTIETTGIPFLGAQWRAGNNEGWSLSLGLPKTAVRYHMNPDLGFKLELKPWGGIYRLSDDSVISSEGFLKQEGWITELGLTWRPHPSVLLDGGIAGRFNAEETVYDKNEKKTGTADREDTAGLYLRAQWFF